MYRPNYFYTTLITVERTCPIPILVFRTTTCFKHDIMQFLDTISENIK